MTWAGDVSYSFGGIGLFRVAYDKLIASAWTVTEVEDSRASEWAAEPVVQKTLTGDTDMDVSVTFTTSGNYDLPIMMIAPGAVVRKNTTTGPIAVEGTDYTWTSRALGRINILATAFWTGATAIVLAAGGYELRGGWIVLSSTGESTQEDLKVGMRFHVIGGASTPIKSGIRWAVYRAWNVSFSSWTATLNSTLRNHVDTDLYTTVHPTFAGKYHVSHNKDRILLSAEAGSSSAWCYVGAVKRIRPKSEQECVLSMVGSRGNLEIDDFYAPVAKTNSAGSTATEKNVGTVWLHDRGQFADATVPVELNANRLTNEFPSGFTPSLNANAFELIDMAPGRNIDLISSPESMIYGVWDGLKMPIKSAPAHKDLLVHQGVNYRVLRMTGFPEKFIAVKEA